MNSFNFLKTFFRDKDVAAVMPSSKYTVKRICRKINCRKDNVIVEYGPGSGVVVKELLKRITLGSRVILVETNKEFAEHLSSIHDSRVSVYNDTAENIKQILQKEGLEKADYVISSIPFSYFSPSLRDRIVRNTHHILSASGSFLVYQFTWHSLKYLKKYFGRYKTNLSLFNIPPFFIFEAVKR